MNQILVILSILFIKKCIGDSDQDECTVCNDPNEHLFCRFPDPEAPPPPECEEMDVSRSNDEFRKEVLHFHNMFRNDFADGTYLGKMAKYGFPPAANMRLLRYDIQLEKLAMRNARNCMDAHDPCRTVKRFHYGQNLGSERFQYYDEIPRTSNLSWAAWMAELKNYDVNDVDYYGRGHHRGKVGHFIAATWWHVRLVGCAQVVYKKKRTDSNRWWRIEVTCNYGPLGQTGRAPMYLRGTPCSKCVEGTKCPVNEVYPNLCVKVDDNMETEDDPYIMPGILEGGNPRTVSDIYIALTPIIVCYFQMLFSS